MNQKSYRKIKMLLLLILSILVIVLEFVLVLCFDMTDFKVVFIILIALFSIFYFLIEYFCNKIYLKKNNNELIKIIYEIEKKSKRKYYDYYKQISEYILSQDLKKIFIIQEMKCLMETENFNIPMISIIFAAIVFMVDNMDRIFYGILHTIYLISSKTDETGSEILAQITVPIIIFYVVIEITKLVKAFRINKYILCLICQIEEDMKNYDIHGISNNEKMLKYLNDNVAKSSK